MVNRTRFDLAARWGLHALRRFFAHGMPVYAAALAYRGLLALVPFALFVLWVLDLFGLDQALPVLAGALRRLRPGAPSRDGVMTPLEGLLSLGLLVGVWSIATGARMLIRALDVAYEVAEARPPARRFAFSVVFLPGLSVVMALAIVLLVVTSRLVAHVAGWVGLGTVVTFVGSWLRLPLAFVLLGLAVSAVYHFGPSVRPPLRAVAPGAALAVVLGAAASFGFTFAVSTFLDYGAAYGGLGAAVSLLVFLHLLSMTLLLGAEVSATILRPPS